MINNDWERFGDEIRRTIQDAVDSGDFRRFRIRWGGLWTMCPAA